MTESKGSIFPDERVWYDQFTSTDWVHDAIADSYRVKELRSRKDFAGRLRIMFDGAQGWILSALSGVIVALMAYTVDVAESVVFDYKYGYCGRAWFLNQRVSILAFCSEKLGTNSNLRTAVLTAIATTGKAGQMCFITLLA